MNIRCYRCGWSFSMSRDAISAAVIQAQTTKSKYHVEHCPKCRQAIKVSVDQLKRAAPKPTPVESADESSSAKS
jgi:hypothetical protein